MVKAIRLLPIWFLLFVSMAARGADTKDIDCFIDCIVSSEDIYEKSPVTFTLTLFSEVADVSFYQNLSSFNFKNLNVDAVNKFEFAGKSYRKQVKGKTYYCFPLEAYSVVFPTKGTYSLDKLDFKVGIACPVIVNDPFWGRIRSSEIKEKLISVEKFSVKVKSLPVAPSGFNFSGAVGEFSIDAYLTSNNIYLNEEAVIVFVIKGNGILPANVMPVYANAFGNGLRLKSVSDSRSVRYYAKEPVSELRLECSFIPESSQDLEIGPIKLGYFDPSVQKYVTAQSKPLKINVKSSVSKKQSITI